MKQDLCGTQGEQPESNENHPQSAFKLCERSSHHCSRGQGALSSWQREGREGGREGDKKRERESTSREARRRALSRELLVRDPTRQKKTLRVKGSPKLLSETFTGSRFSQPLDPGARMQTKGG